MYFSTKLKKNHLFQEKTAFCTNSLPFRPEFRGGIFYAMCLEGTTKRSDSNAGDEVLGRCC